MTDTRSCAMCGASLEGRRRQARFCTAECRRAAWRSRQAEKASRTVSAGAERLPSGGIRARIGPCLEFDLPEDWPERSERFWSRCYREMAHL
jgi:hypothetical protein